MPFFKDELYNQAILKFMYSFKNIYSENINAHNVMFLTGPTKCGKSWFLRYNLRRFQSSSQNPIVLYFDLRDQGMLNFDMFLHNFETMIIKTLVARNLQEMQNTKKPLITSKDLLKVVFRCYDENLFEQDLAKCLDKATNNYSMTAAFQVNQPEVKRQIRGLIDKYRMKEYKETPLLDNFDKLVDLVAQSYNDDKFHAALLLVYDALIRKEQERKPPHYHHSSQMRDGLECLNFLMDLVNHIAGYTQKYQDEHIDKINHEELIVKYRKEKEKYENNLNESPLLGDRHPHCLMVLEGIQELKRMKVCGDLAMNYVDTLLLRLHRGNDKWYRNHFPVILETNMSQYFNDDIYNDVQQSEFTYPTIELLGFTQQQRYEHMKNIFNQDQMALIDKKLGRSIFFLNIFTELAKAKGENETFETMLELKVRFPFLLSQQSEPFMKVKREFLYRLNKLYTHPLLGDLLDNGDIDYALLDVFEQFDKVKTRYISIATRYAREEFLQHNVIKALLDANIIYKSKYYDYLYIEHNLYHDFISEWIKEKKAPMNQYERTRYWLYRKVKGLKFGTDYSGVTARRYMEQRHDVYPKKDYEWEFGYLYYKHIELLEEQLKNQTF